MRIDQYIIRTVSNPVSLFHLLYNVAMTTFFKQKVLINDKVMKFWIEVRTKKALTSSYMNCLSMIFYENKQLLSIHTL